MQTDPSGRRAARPHFVLVTFAVCCLGVAATCSGRASDPPTRSDPPPPPTSAVALPPECIRPPVESADGRRFLALVVGVGDYKAVDKLLGPKNDAEDLRRLLVEQYQFPDANVCKLVDAQATTAAFRAGFEKVLVERARKGDVAVLFFAGHGSQTPDRNGDEPDGWDETILLQDARSGEVHDFVDDELNAMIARLYAKTENVVVLLDSCNSGTATRGANASTARARLQPPEGSKIVRQVGPTSGLADPWVPSAMAHAVVLTAASDGTSALENDGHGVFTSALVKVLGDTGKDGRLTWAAVARRVPDLVKASSPQIPYFQGDLDRDVFGATARPRPMAWEVTSLGPPIAIAGPPVPGMGVHAELRVYRPGLKPPEYSDPGKAKATLVVDGFAGLNATATVAAQAPGAPAIQKGDLAILVRPGDASIQITLRFRPKEREGDGGLDGATVARLRKAIEADRDASVSVKIVGTEPGAFELSMIGDRLVLRGPENNVRNVYASEDQVARSLWQHARQKALRFLEPEGGEDFAANESLEVQIVPSKDQPECGKRRLAEWAQSPANTEQVVPLCVAWDVKVKLSRKAAKAVLVGGVALSSDGGTFGFPADNGKILLQPGEEHRFRLGWSGGLPLDTEDTLRVFGTQESNPVAWSLLTSDVATRGPRSESVSALHRALDRYLTVGTRGIVPGNPVTENTTWTATTIATRVEANARFAAPASASAPPNAREYTIPKFDLRPYLPDDESTALHRVLSRAALLARTQVPYKQHAWAEKTDDQNLAKGIDCSRAVWFAFTRSGLPYGDYLTTAEMVNGKGAMAKLFDPCAVDEPRLGDLLVYRDDARGDGHVVMVIDPAKRIAWGSHGWDGNAAELQIAPQTGVEFQRIKHKPDWDRWDRKNMVAKACWRYRAFAAEASAGKGPGLEALRDSPCDPKRCPATEPPSVVGSR